MLGGQDVREEVVRRRCTASDRKLFRFYAPLAEHWGIYDNSSSAPTLVAHGVGSEFHVADSSH